ncbi:hypothetical protein PR202_ga10053 [Eleusine coracana subsp. coracana]|uniref:non-specific serine/threonine protein kinase n=1 Tax=Eleusine coracana subsp. coracana TaxID=191504 RepID=A0AAV5C5R5_ELECO|nr:hypothetical protein PR202_ga10053 [Eleusine coracana subsp. coracana]
MKYAAGGELFARICSAGRFSEDEARFFFQQLISGVSYCHSMSSVLHSQPKSTVSTPAYIAPEVLARKEYDGKVADVWSCGVTLYVMLVGAYPFEDPDEPRNFCKTLTRILSVQYAVPDFVRVSMECRHLLSRIFVANPEQVMLLSIFFIAEKKTAALIKPFGAANNHPGDQEPPMVPEEPPHQDDRRVPDEPADHQHERSLAMLGDHGRHTGGHHGRHTYRRPGSLANGLKFTGQLPGLGSMDLDDIDVDDIDVDDSGDFVCAL